MKKYCKWILGFGILIWLIPFLASFLIFELKETNRALFESIMPVLLTFVIVTCSILFFKKVEHEYVKEGIIAGIAWFAISIIIDLFLFLPDSPMQMSLIAYLEDIGLTYFIIVMIPIGFGYLLEKMTK